MARWLVFLVVALAWPAWARPAFPWQAAGLTEQQAAAHLLSRFTFGARPGDAEAVVSTGLETWFAHQLAAEGHDPSFSEDLNAQKVLRAVYSENQLLEVMTDFWFNHFNVARQTGGGAFLLDYERRAIRPQALGSFRKLLGATAHHPAMLEYLNNAQSSADDAPAAPKDAFSGGPIHERARGPMGYGAARQAPPPRAKTRGINENYARELMELHTLGVDGGYTQHDVVEVARVLTGWGVAEKAFQFNAGRHDFGAKQILHSSFPPGQGVEEGERVLDMLARHPSTAHNLALKLARRFVCDDPPKALVQRLAIRFGATQGDLREVLWALAASPEFWDSKLSLRAKVKSPFELAVSAVRVLGGKVDNAGPLAHSIELMGQPLYAYQAPTGFPDNAQFWINSGLLLQRMNFGSQLAANQVGGVKIDLGGLVKTAPSSPDEALAAYAPVLLPGRDLKETLKELAPQARDASYPARVAKAASHGKHLPAPSPKPVADPSNAVGVLLGSPEFQRR